MPPRTGSLWPLRTATTGAVLASPAAGAWGSTTTTLTSAWAAAGLRPAVAATAAAAVASASAAAPAHRLAGVGTAAATATGPDRRTVCMARMPATRSAAWASAAGAARGARRAPSRTANVAARSAAMDDVIAFGVEEVKNEGPSRACGVYRRRRSAAIPTRVLPFRSEFCRDSAADASDSRAQTEHLHSTKSAQTSYQTILPAAAGVVGAGWLRSVRWGHANGSMHWTCGVGHLYNYYTHAHRNL